MAAARPDSDLDVDRAFARFVATRDPDALAFVFDRTAPRLAIIAARLVGERHAAEDVVQSTFLEAIRSADGFVADARVVPWLLGILAHQVARVRRKRVPAPGGDALPEAVDLAEPPALAADREVAERIERAVAAMPAPYREVLALRVLHGLRPVDIATALDRPLGTVHAQLHRGLAKLRDRLPAGLGGVLALAFAADRGLAAVRRNVLGVVRPEVSAAVGTAVMTTMQKVGFAAALALAVLLVAGVSGTFDGWFAGDVPKDGGPERTAVTSSPRGGADVGPASSATGAARTAVDATPPPGGAVPIDLIRFVGVVVAVESGAPLAGAVVRPWVETRSFKTVDPRRYAPQAPVTTGADGRFVLDLPRAPDLYLGVEVAAEGRLLRQARLGGLRGGVRVDAGPVPLWRAREVFVQALDPDGAPLVGFGLQAFCVEVEPAGAMRDAVLSFDWGGGAPQAITGPDGVAGPLLLPAGVAALESFATVGRPLPGGFDVREFRVLDVDGPQRVVARVDRRVGGAPIRGIVVGVDGALAGGVGLEFERADDGSAMRATLRVVTFGDDRFEAWCSGPTDGAWRPRVGRAWRLARPFEPVSYGTQDVRVVVEAVPRRAVELRIQDEDGRAIERFGASFEDPDELWPAPHPGGRLSAELPDGVHRLHLRRVGARGDEFARFDVAVDGAAVERALRWPRLVEWDVEVTDQAGQPVTNARIHLRAPEASTTLEHWVRGFDEDRARPSVNGWLLVAVAATDERGRAHVRAPGRVPGAALRVWADDVEPTTVRVDAAPSPGPLRLTVARGATIVGRVVPDDVLAESWPADASDRQLAALVEAEWSVSRGPWSVIVERPGLTGVERSRSQHHGTVAADGSFGVSRLAPGDWDVVLKSDAASARCRLATVRGLSAGELRALTLDASAFRAGRVTGRLLWSGPGDVLVSVWSERMEVGNEWRVGLDGVVGPMRLPEGRYSAVASWSIPGGADHGGFLVRDLPPVVAGRETQWTIAPPVPGGLRLRLTDASGAPLAGRRVHLPLPWRTEWRFVERRTDADGVATWDPSPLARPTFAVCDAAGAETVIGPIPVDASARWTERTVVVPASGRSR